MVAREQRKKFEGVYLSIGPGLYRKGKEGLIKINAVSRDYKGVKFRPEYYMSEKQGEGFKYISGLFRAKDGKGYSMDKLDHLGVKIYYKVRLTKETLKIERV